MLFPGFEFTLRVFELAGGVRWLSLLHLFELWKRRGDISWFLMDSNPTEDDLSTVWSVWNAAEPVKLLMGRTT